MLYNQSELRLGNWINTTHGYVQVVLIGKDVVTTPNLNGVMHGSILSAIPLTTEVFNKCTFPKPLKIGSDNGVILDVKPGKYQYYVNPNANINSLHLLQNIYFFHTGEELEVNF